MGVHTLPSMMGARGAPAIDKLQTWPDLTHTLHVKFSQHLNPASRSTVLAHLTSHLTVPSTTTATKSPKTLCQTLWKASRALWKFQFLLQTYKALGLRLQRAGCLHHNKEQVPLQMCRSTPPDRTHPSTVDTQQLISIFKVKNFIAFYCMSSLSGV